MKNEMGSKKIWFCRFCVAFQIGLLKGFKIDGTIYTPTKLGLVTILTLSNLGPGHVYEMLEGLPEPGVNPIKPASRNADLARLMASAQEFDTSGSDEEMDPATVDDPTR